MRRHSPRWLAALLVAAALLIAGSTTAGAATASPLPLYTRHAERVLIVSMPHVAWRDLGGLRLPNLEGLLQSSGVANLSTRTIPRDTDLADGYITLGAGTRSVETRTERDAAGFEVDEVVPTGRFEDRTAAQVFEERTGRVASRGLVHWGVAAIQSENRDRHHRAEVGALGDSLRDLGFSRAVIGNGDSGPAEGQPTLRRFMVTALMDSDGTVPEGRVGTELLRHDDDAAFGVRLSIPATLDAFREVWKPRSVVLVEASDLVRADALAAMATPGHRDALLRDALRSSDELLGELLAEVNPARDAVVVVSPAHTAEEVTLTVVGVRAPGTQPGLLRSSTTRRTGFVQLIDVAPTVLDLVGAPRPRSMGGRPFTVARSGGSAAQRAAFLVNTEEAAQFRDRMPGAAALTFVIVQAFLALGAVVALGGRPRRWLWPALRFLGPAALGYLPALYLTRLFPLHDAGIVTYWAFVAVVSLLLGGVYRLIGRRLALDPTLVALGALVALLVGDVVLLKSRFQFNNAIGYSPLVAFRFSGLGNVGYAALTASSLLFAGLLAHRIGGRRGAWAGIAILVVALVVDGAPFWGADVGGVLSMIPAFGIAATLLLGARVQMRLRTVLAWGGAAVAGIAVAAGIDLARPARDRTHLGRLLQKIRDEGFGTFVDTIRTKLDKNLTTITTSLWGVMLPIVLAFLAYLALGPERRLGRLTASIPQLRAVLAGFTIAAILGYALNDSGIVVPAVMLGVLNATLVSLIARQELPDAVPQRTTTPARGAQPALAAR